MIKLKKLLTEDTSEEPFTSTEIIQIYKEIKNKQQFKTFLLRGIKDAGFNYRVSQIRNERKLKDTKPHTNSILTAFYRSLGYNIPDRRKCLFTTDTNSMAEFFGRILTLIFPSEKSTIIYNPKYGDSYELTATNVFNISALVPVFKSKYIVKIQEECPQYVSLLNMINEYFNTSATYTNKLDNMLENISFKSLIKEIRIFLTTKFGKEDSNDRYMITAMQNQIDFFKKASTYAKGIQILEKNTELNNDKAIEFIIYGDDEYFQVNYKKFINSFEWTGQEWEPKQHD